MQFRTPAPETLPCETLVRCSWRETVIMFHVMSMPNPALAASFDLEQLTSDLVASISASPRGALNDALQQALATVRRLHQGLPVVTREELESLLAQQSALADQVALSTITVSIASAAIAPSAPTTFLDGLAAGWGALVAAAGAVAVAAGAALPWLAVLGILALGIVVVARRRTTRPSPSAPAPGDATSALP